MQNSRHGFLNTIKNTDSSDPYSDEVTADRFLVPVEEFQKLHLVEAAALFQLVGRDSTWGRRHRSFSRRHRLATTLCTDVL